MGKQLLQQAFGALDEARSDIEYCLELDKQCAGYERYDKRIAFREAHLVKHDAAMQALQKALAECESEPNIWHEAVVDQLIVHHIYQKAHDADPRKAINDLLCLSNQIALDPRVSSDAQALIDRGRSEAQAAHASNFTQAEVDALAKKGMEVFDCKICGEYTAQKLETCSAEPPVMYRFRDTESCIKAMVGYTPPPIDWSPLYAGAQERKRPLPAGERKRFEQWYSANAFDFAANPIGSRDCKIQWDAWKAALDWSDPDESMR